MAEAIIDVEEKLKQKAAGRQAYRDSKGGLVYEWKQTFEDVHVFVKLPAPSIKKTELCVRITPTTLTLGLVNCDPYLNVKFSGVIDSANSFWYIDDGEIILECTKARPGETWKSCFEGHATLDPFLEREVKKQLMLERFGNEHRGFDFSSAKFSGEPPDPRTFFGGPGSS